jgi:IS30 family transposase
MPLRKRMSRRKSRAAQRTNAAAETTIPQELNHTLSSEETEGGLFQSKLSFKRMYHCIADVSSREKMYCMALFSERKIHLFTALQMVKQTADSLKAAIGKLHGCVSENSINRDTTERGKEFSYYSVLEKNLKMGACFAGPYSS